MRSYFNDQKAKLLSVHWEGWSPTRRPRSPCDLRVPPRPRGAPETLGCPCCLPLYQQLVAMMTLSFNSLLQKTIWIKSKRPLPLRFSEITDLEESAGCPTSRSRKECAIAAVCRGQHHRTAAVGCLRAPSTGNTHPWQQLKQTPLGTCYVFNNKW